MLRPRKRPSLALALVAAFAWLGHAAADPPPAPLHAYPSPPEAGPQPEAARPEKPVLLGAVRREQVEAAVPDWVQAEVEAAPDAKAVQALAAVPAGATVTVYLGSWCGDSRREVSRFWRALDQLGGEAPFQLAYVGIDRAKKEPAALVAATDLRYVPTFVVQRDGREVGRIVESAPHGIERDLLSLLDGAAHGLITDRTDLRGEKHP